MEYIKGNLLSAKTDSIVNTVNTVGVMGKGIALQFKEKFPENYRAYKKACQNNEVKIGQMFVFKEQTLNGDIYIINFPTKTEWYKKSTYEYIESGLIDLKNVIDKHNIKSISIPPLGCGNGGLKWEKVKKIIENKLGDLSGVKIQIYEPNDDIKKVLQKENSKKSKLTAARAMLLYSMFQFEKFGESASVFIANKLAYFLQENGENLRLRFDPYLYGPYDQAVEKVLYSLNGEYLKGLEQLSAKPFESIELNYDKYSEVLNFIKEDINDKQRANLDKLFSTIEGFETTLSLELLSSVHFIVKNSSTTNVDDIYSKMIQWNDRKKSLIEKDHVNIALNHLQKSGLQLSMF